jgi:hypothetical protein
MKSNARKIADAGLVYNATDWDGVAINDTTTPDANFYAALHTAWPGRAGTQATSEASYGNYARVAIPRTSAGFTVSGTDGGVTLAANRSFPASSATGNNQYCPFFSIGRAASGAGMILEMGCLVKSGTTARPFTAVTTNNLVTCVGHGAVANDRVVFFQSGSAALPTGITEGTVYYVIAGNLTTDTLNVSATQGGASITVSGAGVGIMMVLDGPTVGNAYTVTLTTSTAIIVD